MLSIRKLAAVVSVVCKRSVFGCRKRPTTGLDIYTRSAHHPFLRRVVLYYDNRAVGFLIALQCAPMCVVDQQGSPIAHACTFVLYDHGE